MISLISITPDPVAVQLGPLPIFWYGVAYAVGLAVVYLVLVRQARLFGQDPEVIGNGLIVIAVAALIGGRLYHVIDQWALYQDDLLKIVTPPYSGLGVYGGLATGIVAFIGLVRYHRLNPWVWADIVAPALFTMQAIGRWGNFFNQELYGPPTNLPWAITIDCAHRVAPWTCDAYPEATTGFQPLFLYESISGAVGAIALIWLSRRRRYPLRPGDQALIFFIWYAVVRFALEALRTGNWTIGGVPTAQIMSVLFALGAFLILLYRHRRPADDPEAARDPDIDDDLEGPLDDPAELDGNAETGDRVDGADADDPDDARHDRTDLGRADPDELAEPDRPAG